MKDGCVVVPQRLLHPLWAMSWREKENKDARKGKLDYCQAGDRKEAPRTTVPPKSWL